MTTPPTDEFASMPAGSDHVPSLCRFGCYWDCEHREGDGREGGGGAGDAPATAGRLMPVHDDGGRELRRCRECGGMFYGLMEHAREHERLRQLGIFPTPGALGFSH